MCQSEKESTATYLMHAASNSILVGHSAGISELSLWKVLVGYFRSV
jgi:hypothetical protein